MVSFFDSTFLKTKEDSGFSEEEYLSHIQSFVMEAIDYKFKLVMIRANYIVFAKEIISKNNSNVLVGTVIDFTDGIYSTNSKLDEIKIAINLGIEDLVLYDFKKKNKKMIISVLSDTVESLIGAIYIDAGYK